MVNTFGCSATSAFFVFDRAEPRIRVLVFSNATIVQAPPALRREAGEGRRAI